MVIVRCGSIAQHQARMFDCVGQSWLPPIADRADRHRRRGPKPFGKHRENRRAGGPWSIADDARLSQRDSPQQLGRGSGNTALAVRDLDSSEPVGTGEATSRWTPSSSKSDDRAHDIGDRIGGPDLVKWTFSMGVRVLWPPASGQPEKIFFAFLSHAR